MDEQQHDLISLYQPDLTGNERRYVLECLESSWISSNGSFVPRFEDEFAKFVGADHAIAVSNGTVALHLALHALGIGPGDEVIVPSFTYIASVNAIAQTGATPVFVDSRLDDWLMDPSEVEKKLTPRSRAIMVVHLFGEICDMPALGELATRNDLAIVEDAAEVVGCTFRNQHAGTFGTVGTFSFYGNKTVTTGEGGMIVTNDASLAQHMRLLKGQGQSPTRRYWHIERGFNYRMTNICAAIGVAQMERLPAILSRKRGIAARYRDLLRNMPVVFQKRSPQVESSEWLVSLLLPEHVDRDEVMQRMLNDGVETRPVFYCAHQMPMYHSSLSLPAAEQISRRGISLPSYPQMTEQQVDHVVEVLRAAMSVPSRRVASL